MSAKHDALSRLGELFLIGFQGPELTDDASAFLSQAKIGGVILFAHNYKNPEQVATLINDVQEARSELPLWIAVDQEGGRVQRFKDPFTPIPTAEKIGKIRSPKGAFEISEIMAKELNAVGVNLNFTPVCDILTNPKNPVIGDRAYGIDEATVSRVVTAVVRGHVIHNVQPCVKHFPGHGDTDVDSHEGLPVISTPIETLREREFKPFIRTFKSRCSMVMMAHILNQSIDPEFPATLSEKTIRGILRSEIRFTKVVVSDDMEMKAITNNYGAEDAPLLAVKAGCDLLVYRSEEAARNAYQALVNALESGKLDPVLVLEAAERLRTLKAEKFEHYEPTQIALVKEIVGCEAHKTTVKNLLA